MRDVHSSRVPTGTAVALYSPPAQCGSPADGGCAPSTVLGLRARSVTEWLRKVERAEATYAAFHKRPRRRPGSGSRLSTAFEALAKAVGGLRVAWQLFRLRAAADGVPWQDALRSTVPDLFSVAVRQPDGLRQDTAFSYAIVQSAHDVAACFLWRLERGYC